MTRRSRSRSAILAILGLLFGQFSLLAYACPAQGEIDVLEAAAATSTAMVDCADRPAARADANLCGLHCQDLAKSATVAAGDEPPAPTLAFALAPAVAERSWSPAARGREAFFAQVAAPPLAIRFCRFLI